MIGWKPKRAEKQPTVTMTCAEVCAILDDNTELYDLLPGNGQDDYILQTIRRILRAAYFAKERNDQA